MEAGLVVRDEVRANVAQLDAAIRSARDHDLGDRVHESRGLCLHFRGALAGEVGLDQERGHEATVGVRLAQR